MKSHANYAKVISCYAADTSGVCSALYELGGMTVVHDASGCNSTYTTHDEPRWYDKESMIYISALTEADAVFGNDEKFISDVSDTAKELNPQFIAICGSPMPMMTGFDYSSAAEEIMMRTGIKTIGIPTNGINSYLWGESMALTSLAEKFCADMQKTKNPSVNILGASPLDFSINGSIESIKELLSENGFETVCCAAMGSSLEDFSKMGSAWVNLVVSYGGFALAEYLQQRFGTPFVTAVPIGKDFGKTVAEKLKTAYENGGNIFLYSQRNGCRNKENEIVIVGESIFSASLACAIESEKGKNARVICPLETDKRLLSEKDSILNSEKELSEQFKKARAVIADGLYRPICPENIPFYNLPHEAFSGRCYRKLSKNLIGKELENIKL